MSPAPETGRFSPHAISLILRIAAMIGRDVCPDPPVWAAGQDVRLDVPVVCLRADDGGRDFVSPVAVESYLEAPGGKRYCGLPRSTGRSRPGSQSWFHR